MVCNTNLDAGGFPASHGSGDWRVSSQHHPRASQRQVGVQAGARVRVAGMCMCMPSSALQHVFFSRSRILELLVLNHGEVAQSSQTLAAHFSSMSVGVHVQQMVAMLICVFSFSSTMEIFHNIFICAGG